MPFKNDQLDFAFTAEDLIDFDQVTEINLSDVPGISRVTHEDTAI